MGMISNSRIDKIGNKLKTSSALTQGEFEDLLTWRNLFSSPLDYYHTRLKELIEPDSIVAIAKRLKRIESIRIKLERFKTMRLSTLQDIAGSRVILKNKDDLESAVVNIRNAETINKLKRLDNYHHRPKDNGYRGIHIIFQTRHSKMIEIQLRTQLQHIWATAVEVYGTLQFVSFKTGEGAKEWKDFFKLLSSYFAILENCIPLEEHSKFSQKKIISMLKKSIKDLSVIERLNAAANNVEVLVSRRSKGRPGKYALLELDYRNNKTTIDIFNKKEVSKAIEEYTKKELAMTEDHHSNIVFVNIESLEEIKKTYPNYFLDTKELLTILSNLVLGREN